MGYSQEPYISHYGVLGMKWGVRKDKQYSNRKINRMAKKDAKEYARAKMSTGEGAGNRRKHINATVNQRSKDSRYSEAFKKNLEAQDMAKHAKAAKKERKVKDTKRFVGKTVRGVIGQAAGTASKVAASSVVVYYGLRVTGMDQVIIQKGQQILSSLFK